MLAPQNSKRTGCVLVFLADTQQTATLMRKMWVRRTAERQLSHIARVSPTTNSQSLYENNVLCTVFLVTSRSSKLMVPAKQTCPRGGSESVPAT